MERSFVRISPENLVSVAILSGFAYLGVVGATMLVAKIKSMKGGA